MKREKNFKTAKFTEALEYIDVRFIEEAGKRIKARPTGIIASGKPNRAKSLRQVLALVACVLLLSAIIPALTYLVGHMPDILGSSTGDNTTEQTHHETPPEETTVPAPETTETETALEETTDAETTIEETTVPETTVEETIPEETTAEETTAPPEPEYDGSRGLEYKVNSDGKTASLVGIGTCTDKEIIVASTYNGLPVTRVDYSFSKISGITSVTLSDTVLTVGGIDNMPDLISVYFSKSVEGINPESLIGCPKLEVIEVDPSNPKYQSAGNCLIEKATKTIVHGCKGSVIPTDGSVTVIGEFAFHACDWLTELNIPDVIERVDSYAFAGCDNLKKAVLPDSLTYLGFGAFFSCESLESVILGKNFEYLCGSVFEGCSKLKELQLPKTLKLVSALAFFECPSLKKVSYAGTMAEWKAVEKTAMWNDQVAFTVVHCSDGDVSLIEYDGSRGLEYKIVEDHALLIGIGTCTDKEIVTATTYNGLPVTEIDDFAFENVGGFTSITVSEGVTSIGLNAFASCPDLRAVYLPSTLENISGGEGIGFYGCNALEIIQVAKDNPKYTSVGNCLIEKATKVLVLGCKASKIPTDGSVEKIGYFAFRGISSIKEIVIPEGITEIYGAAFSGCDKLERITLPKSLIGIRDSAFAGCSSLKSIHVYDGVTYIGSRAFANCTALKEIRLPANVEYFGEEMFAGCAIESIVIPKGVTDLSGGMFINCTNLKSVTFLDRIEKLGMYTFSRCISLTEFNVPEGVKVIGQATFEDCANLVRITLPESIEEIEQYAFSGCSSLTDFRYEGTKAKWAALEKGKNWNSSCPFTVVRCSDGNVELFTTDGSQGLEYQIDGDHAVLVGIGTCTDKEIVTATTYNGLPVTAVSANAFRGNKTIVSVRLGDNVESIGYEAFSGCDKLESIYISAAVREIGFEAFINNPVLAHITVDEKNPYFSGEGNCIVEKATKTLILGSSRTVIPTDGSVEKIGNNAFCGNELLSTITIPEGVTEISSSAFNGCTNLVYAYLPESLQALGPMSFYGCKRLQSIDIPQSVSVIPEYAFYNCAALRSVSGGEGVTSIEPRAFEGCVKLTAFEFGKKLTKIDHLAFKGCTSLRSVDIPASVTEIGQETFSGCTALESVTVRGDVQMLYAGVFAKCSSLRSVNLLGSVGSISQYAFEFCTSLESITLPEGTKIGRGAFYECTALKSINIPRGGTEIGDEAFSGCIALTEIVIPEGVETIELEAFYRCHSLKTVSLPSTLTEIGSWAFAECESLESIVIPDSVTWVSDRAFSDCRALSSVKFGKSIELIMENAFMNCTSLKSVALPESLIELSGGAFAGCSNLESVTFEKGIDRLGTGIFSDCLKLKNIRFIGTVAEWRSVFVPEDALGNITVEKIVCSDGECEFYPPAYTSVIPEVYRAVLNGEESFVLDSNRVFLTNYNFPYYSRPITTVYDLTYTVLDMNGDGRYEVVIRGDGGDTLVLHEDGGTVYGFDFTFRNMDRIKTNGSFEWNDTTSEGLCYGDRRISFDGGTCKLIDICHVIGDGTENSKYFVDGAPATLEEYLARANLIPQSEPTWYPLEAPKAN